MQYTQIETSNAEENDKANMKQNMDVVMTDQGPGASFNINLDVEEPSRL